MRQAKDSKLVRRFLLLLVYVAFVAVLRVALHWSWDVIVPGVAAGLSSAWLGPRIGPLVRPDIYNADGTKRAKGG